ncbi:EamA family transporter [Reichenbachiella sp. MALMAid0571]|uniref:DMT family transporter n=1 Tax=Reichenbachiella sp. MALMAid0571 TaxID=3143939 RepID=UPI0032DECCD9
MRSNNLPLFAVPALIWGSTWFVITYQLGSVDPLISVVYRYLIAGVLLLGYCLAKGVNMIFSLKDHVFMVFQGILLFGVNYWLVYEAEQYIASALVAVAFSTVIFMNSGFGALFLGRQINKKVITAAVAGLCGTVLIFWGELSKMQMSGDTLKGTILAVGSVVLASLGNITSARNSQEKIPVLQANTFGMLYGCTLMAIVALILGRPFTFDVSAPYVLSLIYLSLFGSIVAFGTYLTLVGRIGADKAAYALVIIPVIAIVMSLIFEDYQITLSTFIGVLLILGGNILALRK